MFEGAFRAGVYQDLFDVRLITTSWFIFTSITSENLKLVYHMRVCLPLVFVTRVFHKFTALCAYRRARFIKVHLRLLLCSSITSELDARREEQFASCSGGRTKVYMLNERQDHIQLLRLRYISSYKMFIAIGFFLLMVGNARKAFKHVLRL